MQNESSIKVWSERWRLGALSTPELMQIGLVSVMVELNRALKMTHCAG